jgi:hypothetical protein
MRTWVYDPHSGGCKIPPQLHQELSKKAELFVRTHAWCANLQLKLRFKSQFCYVDTMTKNNNRIFPLCRLRYFKSGVWSFAIFTYSNEHYEPHLFPNGQWKGTLEQALEVCEPLIPF